MRIGNALARDDGAVGGDGAAGTGPRRGWVEHGWGVVEKLWNSDHSWRRGHGLIRIRWRGLTFDFLTDSVRRATVSLGSSAATAFAGAMACTVEEIPLAHHRVTVAFSGVESTVPALF